MSRHKLAALDLDSFDNGINDLANQILNEGVYDSETLTFRIQEFIVTEAYGGVWFGKQFDWQKEKTLVYPVNQDIRGKYFFNVGYLTAEKELAPPF